MTTLVGSRKTLLMPEPFPDAPVVFEPASTIKNRSVRWGIPYLIALGDVTIIAGPKKCGKSKKGVAKSQIVARGKP